MSLVIKKMRQTLRAVDTKEADRIIEELASLVKRRLPPQLKNCFDDKMKTVVIGRIVLNAIYYASEFSDITYEDMLDYATDETAIDSDGELQVVIANRAIINGVTYEVSVTVYRRVPAEDIRLLDALGKVQYSYYEPTRTRSFIC